VAFESSQVKQKLKW